MSLRDSNDIFPNKDQTEREIERQRGGGWSVGHDGLTSLSLPLIRDCDVRWMGVSRALLALHATSLPLLPVSEVKGVPLSLPFSSSIGERSGPPPPGL